jgi:hypothetical protein
MKKTLLFIAIACMSILGVKAQDIIKLGVTDDIKVTLAAYTGNNVVLVIPEGYTNPQSTPVASTTTPITYSWNTLDLSTLTNLTSTTKITFMGDGTSPTLTLKTITLPPALSKIEFQGLTITGASPFSLVPGNPIDPTANYVFNQGASAAAMIDSLVFDNCNISSLRSTLRFQGTSTNQGVNNIIINNCIEHNFADYGVLYCSILTSGPTLGKVKVSKSTFYGFGASVFALQSNATSVDISDCTFDNIINITGSKLLVDLKALVVPVTITNCILGKAISTAKTVSTGGTLTITNSYTTSDWLAAGSTATAGITGAFTAITDASTDLFTSVSVSTAATASTPYTTTVGNYKIKDTSFAGANSAGDPRWYLNAVQGIKQVLSDKGVSFNGTEIVNKNGLSIEVYSVLGKRVTTSMTNISTTNFRKGIYIVRVSGTSDSLKICI